MASVSDRNFLDEYRALEQRMRALAEAEGDVYLPNPEPPGPADYILICMEPSLGGWARTADQGRQKVLDGYRNFVTSLEDFILHFSVRRYLCRPGQTYHITDISKGAMTVERAGIARTERYDRWYALLIDELNLCAAEVARIIAVGRAVEEHLHAREFARPFQRVLHYSGQAGPARRAGIRGREEAFEAFKESIVLGDVVAAAEEVLAQSGVPQVFGAAILGRMAKSNLSTSRKQLIFTYKLEFERMSRETQG